jgi:hypothetical protein
MTSVDDPESGDPVEVFLAVDVPERGPLAFREDLHPIVFGDFNPGQVVSPHVFAGDRIHFCRCHRAGSRILSHH